MIDTWIARKVDVIAGRAKRSARPLAHAQESAAEGHQGAHLRRRQRREQPQLFREPGDIREHRKRPGRCHGRADRRQGRGGHRDRFDDRGQPEHLDGVHARAPGREVPRDENRRRQTVRGGPAACFPSDAGHAEGLSEPEGHLRHHFGCAAGVRRKPSNNRGSAAR